MYEKMYDKKNCERINVQDRIKERNVLQCCTWTILSTTRLVGLAVGLLSKVGAIDGVGDGMGVGLLEGRPLGWTVEIDPVLVLLKAGTPSPVREGKYFFKSEYIRLRATVEVKLPATKGSVELICNV